MSGCYVNALHVPEDIASSCLRIYWYIFCDKEIRFPEFRINEKEQSDDKQCVCQFKGNQSERGFDQRNIPSVET